ncbi:MAG: NfeD family protein [Gallionella sp.]
MDFITWLVIGVLFILAESAIGRFYLVAIGLACIYPAIYAYNDATIGTQLTTFSLGVLAHSMVALIINKLRKVPSSKDMPTDVGQRVEVIEWIDEGTGRVMYDGKEWTADKVDAEMPDAPYGIITKVQYGRLVITTEELADTQTYESVS